MHYYSIIPFKERMTVYIIIIVLSTLLAIGISWSKDLWPGWLKIVPLPGSMGIIYFIFNKWLWRIPQLKALGFCIPDLRGEWIGIIRPGTWEIDELECKVTIRQDWERIAIVMETENSKSQSEMAFFNTRSAEGVSLCYLYKNNPKSPTVQSMNMHQGTASLVIKEQVLEGYYYTGRGRQTFGDLRLKRKNITDFNGSTSYFSDTD